MTLNYPSELPVSEHREEILAAIRTHQVVVVCGDTGSGKTTQLPKMLLEHFTTPSRRPPLIACTQPRRLAAVTMAERVAQETQTPLGGLVGFQHRYGRNLSRDTQIKLLTDGVLLAETRTDPLLRAYSAIIVDEAHERSLNIDFLLGILKRILPRRRDLKVLISSATLDVEKFSAFFDHAPVIAVPGRLFPIDISYLPPPSDDPDLPRDVASALQLLPPSHDTLVFLPGERDIRETADHLAHHFPKDDIIPLLASLPAAEQQRAFHPSPRRRIILATNVAETSVTIPGIRCVIDSGLARISRYIHRTQVQRLQIEAVSQASSRQRAGRCGRIGPGTCIRLFSEEDFAQRDEFTAPEILRSSLAGVILTMLDLRLGNIEQFPFIDPPKSTMIHEGLRELLELGALEGRGKRDGGREKREEGWGKRDENEGWGKRKKEEWGKRNEESGEKEIRLTEIGRKLAKIPVEPRLARILLAAAEKGVLPEALPIVAAMSCDDPRRRPVDEREKATQAHAQFRVKGSDFLGTLKLWQWWNEQNETLSQSKLRTLAKKTYLSYPKMREWRDLARQLSELCRRLKLSFAEAPEQERQDLLHRALLCGLLGRIGHFDPEEHEYRGAHGLRFALHPSSVLTKKISPATPSPSAPRKPKPTPQYPEWIIAGELVDTSRLFARNAAAIDSGWIESAAQGICKRHCHSPEWDAQSGFVRATEQVTLYGLVIVPARRCDFSRYDFPFAREIFIRRGLVDGEFPHPPPLVRANNALLESLRQHAERSRHPELFAADRLFAHFDALIPSDVASAPAFCKWLKARSTPPQSLARLALKKEDWWPQEHPDNANFPNHISIAGARMALSYRHTPDAPDEDGITCTVKKSLAPALKLWRADWLVPGALPEKISYLLSTLPTAQRRLLFPISDTVTQLMSCLKPGSLPLVEAMSDAFYEHWGLRIDPEAFSTAKLPPHLQVRFCIRDDETSKIIAASRNLDEALAQAGVAAAANSLAITPKRQAAQADESLWTFGDLSSSGDASQAGWKLQHYTALHDEGDRVTLHLHPDERSAAIAHASGVTRLFTLALRNRGAIPFRRKSLSLATKAYLQNLDYDDNRISADVYAGAVREAMVRNLPPVTNATEFERRLAECFSSMCAVQAEISRLFVEAVEDAARLDGQLHAYPYLPDTVDSVRSQLGWLVYRGFPARVPLARLRHFPRYLRGVAIRLERAKTNPQGDLAKEERIAPYWQLYQDAVTGKSKVKFDLTQLAEYRWMVEEYRVSVFAQELHTAEPVSPKRLDAKLAQAVCVSH